MSPRESRMLELIEAAQPKWHRPSARTERGELSRVADDEKVPLKHLLNAFKKAKLKPLHHKTWAHLQNTDSQSTKTMAKFVKTSEKYGRDWKRVAKGLTKGHSMPAPIILRRKDGSNTLVGGNTRLMGAKALKIKPHALHIDIRDAK